MTNIPTRLHIRPAQLADAEAVADIRIRAWQAAYREFMPADYLAALDPQDNLDALRSVLQSPAPLFLLKLAEFDGNAVAFSILGAPRNLAVANTSASAQTLELWALNVEPHYWRKGIAKTLLQECLKDAQSHGASKLQLCCIAENKAARRLYEHCGFIATAQQRTTSVLTGHPLHEVEYVYAF